MVPDLKFPFSSLGKGHGRTSGPPKIDSTMYQKSGDHASDCHSTYVFSGLLLRDTKRGWGDLPVVRTHKPRWFPAIRSLSFLAF